MLWELVHSSFHFLWPKMPYGNNHPVVIVLNLHKKNTLELNQGILLKRGPKDTETTSRGHCHDVSSLDFSQFSNIVPKWDSVKINTTWLVEQIIQILQGNSILHSSCWSNSVVLFVDSHLLLDKWLPQSTISKYVS